MCSLIDFVVIFVFIVISFVVLLLVILFVFAYLKYFYFISFLFWFLFILFYFFILIHLGGGGGCLCLLLLLFLVSGRFCALRGLSSYQLEERRAVPERPGLRLRVRRRRLDVRLFRRPVRGHHLLRGE